MKSRIVLTLKLFISVLCDTKNGRERWIYGAAAARPGYCESAAFWSCQSVLRPLHTFPFVPGLRQVSHLRGEQSYWWPRLLCRRTQLQLPAKLSSVFSTNFALYQLFFRFTTFYVSSLCKRTDRLEMISASLSVGVLCFLFMNRLCKWPLRHREGTSIRLVPFTKKRWEEDIYGRIKK